MDIFGHNLDAYVATLNAEYTGSVPVQEDGSFDATLNITVEDLYGIYARFSGTIQQQHGKSYLNYYLEESTDFPEIPFLASYSGTAKVLSEDTDTGLISFDDISNGIHVSFSTKQQETISSDSIEEEEEEEAAAAA
uniref:UN3 n=1 Tax=Ehrlichia ewingii TaxID=947 RepID=B1N6C3_9RICK|nr:UN3 [Ehrlichia ewingii]